MSSEAQQDTQPTGADRELDEAKFLWDEYRYRHEHCWRLIFQITTAEVTILLIPYINIDITKSVGLWIVALPLLAILLVVFSILRLKRELGILGKIRAAHRERQEKIHPISYKKGHSTFTRDVIFYLVGLAVVGVADIFALVYIWLPNSK